MSSERDTLKGTLPPDVHDEIDEAFDHAQDPDPRDVVADLHKKGVLDAGQLKDAVVALESKEKIRHVARKLPDQWKPEIMGQLGAGAMGEVLIAKDPGLGRVVAVKRIHADAAKNKGMMRRFYTEAQVTAQLDHPSIVPIHGLFKDEDDGTLSYAMKLVRGRTLEDYLDEAGEDPYGPEHNLKARLERFLHACDAMSYAHERGILHRDLKPENIMVGAFGEVLVMDWGIAKILSHRDDPPMVTQEVPLPEPGKEPTPPPAPKRRKGTKVGQVMGTPRYMSPEQAEGRNDIMDARSDQYALGMILQEVVTLQPAIPGDMELPAVLGWAQQGKRRPMSGADRELVAIVDKACAKDPARRYTSVAELAEDIRRHLRDEPTIALPDGMGARIQRWIGRHRRLAMMAIMGLGGFVVVGGSGLIAAGGSLLAIQTVRAQQREAALTNVLHRAIGRAQAVDAALHDIEALTTGVAYASNAAMESPAPRLPYSVTRDDPPNKYSAGQHGKVSVDYASVGVRKGSSTNTADLERLAGLGSVMTEAMVATQTGDARRIDGADRAKKLGSDSPVAWSKVGLMAGAMARAPGTDGYDARLDDFRKDDWFSAPKKHKGATWSEPHLDPKGMGQVIPVSVPWFNSKGGIEGVAAMDVSVEWLQRKIKAVKGVDGVWLLDEQGRIMVASDGDPTKKPSFEELPYEHAKHITPGKSGWYETWDGKLAVWSPLKTTGWTWVVIAPSHVLRDQAGEAIEKN